MTSCNLRVYMLCAVMSFLRSSAAVCVSVVIFIQRDRDRDLLLETRDSMEQFLI